jgi:hypothetical protein
MPRRNVIIVRLASTCVRVVRRPTSRGAATHSVKDLLNGHFGCGLVPFAPVTIVPGQRILDAPRSSGRSTVEGCRRTKRVSNSGSTSLATLGEHHTTWPAGHLSNNLRDQIRTLDEALAAPIRRLGVRHKRITNRDCHVGVVAGVAG